ncbi:MAG: hypothetical protein LBR91_03620 [Puniceicoccales bacterium]|jgi:hypothetical protein|nr:hypothetical protein [Puniceicoccales bacterium]
MNDNAFDSRIEIGNQSMYDAPAIPDELRLKPNYDFEKADLQRLKNFATELGIVIPDDLIGGVELYDTGYFFSTDNTLIGPTSHYAFVDLVKLGKPLLSFGQSGYGFNSYTFSILYVNEKFGYFFTIPFGGAFTDNDAMAKYITEAFEALSAFIKKADNVSDHETNWTVILDEFPTIDIQKIDKATGQSRNALAEVKFR